MLLNFDLKKYFLMNIFDLILKSKLVLSNEKFHEENKNLQVMKMFLVLLFLN